MAKTPLTPEEHDQVLTALRELIDTVLQILPISTHEKWSLIATIADEYLAKDLQEYEKERTHV